MEGNLDLDGWVLDLVEAVAPLGGCAAWLESAIAAKLCRDDGCEMAAGADARELLVAYWGGE
ncbi:MAG: hypothetical protein HQL38_16910 [Alphaproteobacteria bacterium]|nr:hypothetical protein [Alphaproteobacteria bacterium]